MDQAPCFGQFTDHGHYDAPFGNERNRYLRHCAGHGAASAVLKIKRNELLLIAEQLGPDARQVCRHGCTSADCQSAAKPSRGGHRRAQSNRYRAAMATISRLMA
jgi:hypothetical protein